MRAGRCVDPESRESQGEGVRRSRAMLADDDRFDATAVQTLDAKGWDGFAVALITHPGLSSGGSHAERH